MSRPIYKNIGLFAFASAFAFVFISFGNGSPPPAKPKYRALPQHVSEIDKVCASPLFGLGRRMELAELDSYDTAKFGLESFEFRDVLYRSPEEIDSAYRVSVKMRLNRNQFLVPEHELLCKEDRHPSRRTETLASTMIPVLGDLHLPSGRITVFEADEGDRLYNYPRISEISVSSSGYFSFNQNWTPYRKLVTLSDYLLLLRERHFFRRTEVRDLGSGRIAIVAEKNVGGERAQLFITLSETQPGLQTAEQQ